MAGGRVVGERRSQGKRKKEVCTAGGGSLFFPVVVKYDSFSGWLFL